jgi:OmcA/MtrC family decaheme c-type cytochrome
LASLAAAGIVAVGTAWGQVPPAWEATPNFRYSIESIDYNANTRVARVFFSVTNPSAGEVPWDIKADWPFTQLLPSAVSRLSLDIGWNTREYTNAGSGSPSAAAAPISVDLLKNATEVVPDSGIYVASATLPTQAKGTGIAAIEGHPAWAVDVGGLPATAPVPVKNAYKYFGITDSTIVPRREIVDFNKCKVCHDGTDIPRLSLHGSNRTEELHVCVICHNPNQTDIPFRKTGAEESVDFKRMVHGIHAGGMRRNPLVIIGRGSSVNDFSGVRFPANLANCLKCHIDRPGQGTYQIPLASSVLGSVINTKSTLGGAIDVNPANDLKITPVASVCSSCHDSAKAIYHMKSKGKAGFGVLQSQIDSGSYRERCVSCHGPGKDKDVRRVHEIEESGR